MDPEHAALYVAISNLRIEMIQGNCPDADRSPFMILVPGTTVDEKPHSECGCVVAWMAVIEANHKRVPAFMIRPDILSIDCAEDDLVCIRGRI